MQKAWKALSRQRQDKIKKALGPLAFQGLLALTEQSNPQLFYSGLYRLGSHWEGQRQYALAKVLYSLLIQIPQAGTWGKRARERLDLLKGRGKLGDRLEMLGREFFHELMDPSLLIGMGVAQGVFRGVSRFALKRLGNLSLGSRGLAWTLGLSAEVPSFSLTVRGFRELQGLSQNWSREALGRDLFHTGLMLFSLKSMGALGTAAMGGMKGSAAFSNRFLRFSEKALPQAAMLTGILGANYLSTEFRLKGPSSPDKVLLESLTTLLHFNLIGSVFHQIWPQQASEVSNFDHSKKNSPRHRLQLVSPIGSNGRRLPPGIILMEDNSSTTPPSRSSRPTGTKPVRIPPSPLPSALEANSNPLQAQLNNIRGEMIRFYRNPEDPRHWTEAAQDWTRQMQELTEPLELEVHLRKPGESGQVALKNIFRELKRTELLLNYLEGLHRLGRLDLPPSDSPIVKSFLQNLIRTPAQLQRFMLGKGQPLGPLFATFKAQRGLNSIYLVASGQDFFGNLKRPPSSRELHQIQVQEADRISGVLFRMYFKRNFSPNGLGVIHQSALDFQRLLEFTREDLVLSSSPNPRAQEINPTLSDVRLIVQSLDTLKRGHSNSSSAPPLELVIHRLYKGPNRFLNFLNSGKESDLEGTAQAMAEAKQAFLEINPNKK